MVTHAGALALGALAAQVWPLLDRDAPEPSTSDVEVVTHRVTLPDAPDGFRLERFRESGREAAETRRAVVEVAPELVEERPSVDEPEAPAGERRLTRTPVEREQRIEREVATSRVPTSERRLERPTRGETPAPSAERQQESSRADPTRREASSFSAAESTRREERTRHVAEVREHPQAEAPRVVARTSQEPEGTLVDPAESRTLAQAGGTGTTAPAQARVVRRSAPSEPWFEVVVHSAQTVDQAREVERRLQNAELPVGVITVEHTDGSREAQVVLRARGDADSRQDMIRRAQALLGP